MKKIFSIILVVAMVLAMCVPALAEGTETGSITINNAVVGETYTIYRLFNLESYDEDSNAYSYKLNRDSGVVERFFTEVYKDHFVTIDSNDYVTWVEGSDLRSLAGQFLLYVKDQEHVHGTTFNQGQITADSTTVQFTNLELGYYLVDTSLGTICSLDTTNPDVEINEKNSIILIDKKVQENSTGAYGDYNDAYFGEMVNFKTTIYAKKGSTNYILHDIMSEGLSFVPDSVVVTDGSKTLEKDVDYVIKENVPCKDKTGEDATCDFHIEFKNSYINTIDKDTEIVVSYDAQVGFDAVIGLPGNTNDTRLQYSDDNYTEWDTTTTYTWDFNILKYANGDETDILAGAEFMILDSTKEYALYFDVYDITSEGRPYVGSELLSDGSPLRVLTTDENGMIKVRGLDSGTYYLREIKAPDGYNKLTEDIEIVITGATEDEETNELSYETFVAKINNNSGTELPSTGARGTVLFISIGSVLAVVAVVFMVTRKKMSVYEG